MHISVSKIHLCQTHIYRSMSQSELYYPLHAASTTHQVNAISTKQTKIAALATVTNRTFQNKIYILLVSDLQLDHRQLICHLDISDNILDFNNKVPIANIVDNENARAS